MTIIIFLIVLSILVFVHEWGHFIVAKKSGIRVDEFGIGFPPKIFSWKRGETIYSINLIPIGGFVKIFGENPDEESISGPDSARSFVNKPKHIQVAVLSAGVICNIIFAWLLISLGFMFGYPVPASDASISDQASTELMVVSVLNDSPAEGVGIKQGDIILKASVGNDVLENPAPEVFSEFISKHSSEEVDLDIRRGREEVSISVLPKQGIDGGGMIGVGIEDIALLKLPIHKALITGVKATYNLFIQTVSGLATFVYNTVTGHGDFSQVAGPVGIAGLIGGAYDLGLVYLLSFTAFISINLAVINLVPFPALDGGRILFVIIEKIKGSAINPKVANTLNLAGFIILILLMVAVTASDLLKIF